MIKGKKRKAVAKDHKGGRTRRYGKPKTKPVEADQKLEDVQGCIVNDNKYHRRRN